MIYFNKKIEESIKSVSNLLEEIKPEEAIILSHEDHDGLTSSVLFDVYLYNKYNKRIRIIHPTKESSYIEIFKQILRSRPKYLIILDALVSNYKNIIEKILKYTIVINIDHHDILETQNENYINLNPHKFGLEYINSSGLSWLILMKLDESYFEKRCWIAGIGAAQDYCIEDNYILFQELKRYGYLEDKNLEHLINSKIMKLAKMINAAIREGKGDYTYNKLFYASLKNDPAILDNDNIFNESYNDFIKNLENVYKEFNEKKIEKDPFIFFNLNGRPIYYITYISELEKKSKIYVGYSNGLLGFRSLFYNYDVRTLAKYYNGGGPHPKIAGGKTKKKFEEFIRDVYNIYSKESKQKRLDIFLNY